MPGESEPSRRSFLKASASAFAVALVERALRADAHEPAGYNGLRVLRPDEGRTVEAISARIWPGDAKDPGAREAGAVYYIDQALAGPYARELRTYRRGLAALDRFSQTRFKNAFADVTEAQQDQLLHALQDDHAAGFTRPSAPEFFRLVRRHILEGVFADPIYGGNRDFAGWRALGYPGAYYLYTEEEQLSSRPLNKPFQSVADL